MATNEENIGHMSIKQQLEILDAQLSEEYGAYASFSNPQDPPLEFLGPSAADEMRHLLDVYATAESSVLDLGCGAGFSLCRLAPKVKTIWGFDQDNALLEAARLRARAAKIENAMFVLGNNSNAADFDQLPEGTFDLGFSQRGPNLTRLLLSKLKPDAIWAQEFAQLPLGLNELFGRTPSMFRPHSTLGGDGGIGIYMDLGMLVISVRTLFYEQFFSDIHQLDAYLGRYWCLINNDYHAEKDRPALELYCRYSTTPRGIRLTHFRTIGVYRRVQSE
jgi:SAM-dependent methyltransferase